ncbi:MAG TPA: lipopolysaccharide biosynthesis protein [Sphingomonas sp.]|nr:lipopolysaccharide biosynthesis protein [Sphingomonas sp.]
MTDSPHRSRRRSLPEGVRATARNLGWLMASRGVIAVLSLVYLGVATRSLGVADFGRFALITGAAQAIAVMVGFQTWQIVVRYGVDHVAADDEVKLGRLLRLCVLLDCASAVVGGIVSTIILEIWGDSFGITRDLLLATIGFVFIELITIRSTPVGILRLRDKFSLAALADSTTPVMRFLGAIAAALLMPTVTGFLIAWAVAEVATSGTYWLMVMRTGDLALVGRGRGRGVFRENAGLVRFMLSTNATSTLGLSTKQAPLLLVGGYVGPAAAGAFRLAFQIAQALAKLSQLLSRAAFPEIVRAVRTPKARNVSRMIVRVFLVSAAAALVILAIVAALGHPLLLLVGGKDFRYGRTVMLWLAAAGCVDLATVSFEPVLMAAHRAGTALAARVVAAVALIGVSLYLLPRYGTSGAGMGVMAGSATAALLLGWAVIRYVRSERDEGPASGPGQARAGSG